MNEEQYIEDRLQKQIDWYDRKSQFNKSWFSRLRLLEIISASLIPLLTGFSDRILGAEWCIASLGVLIAISAATSSLFKFHENWIHYRTTAEQLGHEKYLFLTKVGPYENGDSFNSLVTRAESLISKENSNWSHAFKNKRQEHNK